VWFAAVPASVTHELDFFGGRAMVVYVEPHAPDYGSFHRWANGTCPTSSSRHPDLDRALCAWRQTGDPGALVNLTQAALPCRAEAVDPRLRAIAMAFNRAEWLEASVAEIGRLVHLSESRLAHLLKAELGVGFRRLKQYYRFKLALSEVASGTSLTTAAHGAGFADSAHLSRAFTQTFGLSPASIFTRSVVRQVTAELIATA
jgi:AraC-like DNA-binding protein